MKSTLKVIENLVDIKINLNITAIFTYNQVSKILPSLKNTNSIISVFAEEFMIVGLMHLFR